MERGKISKEEHQEKAAVLEDIRKRCEDRMYQIADKVKKCRLEAYCDHKFT